MTRASLLVGIAALSLAASACPSRTQVRGRPDIPSDELAVTRAVLYQNGIGYFERRGRISGNQLTLRIRPDQIADFLKSITIVDLSKGGRAVSVALPVEKSQARQMADLPPQVREQGGILAIAAAFRGARARIDGDEGTIVGVERVEKTTGNPDQPVVGEWRITLLLSGGSLKAYPVGEIEKFKILDKTLTVGLEKALQVSLNEGAWKPIELTVQLAGDGPHDVVVSYVVEMPTWKPAYRVVVGPDKTALFQGWAVVDNVSGEDWYDIELSLTAGTPLAFAYDLYTPHYVRRPDLSLPEETYGVLGPMGTGSGYGDGDYDDYAGAADEGWEGEYSPPPAATPTAPGGGAGKSASRAEKATPRKPVYDKRKVTTEDLERNYQSLVQGTGVGSLFRYDLDEPITVRDRESALVSVVSTKVPGEDVMLFRAGIDYQNPYRMVKLKNETGFVMERGPVAIYRENTFVGEALTAKMEKGATVFVPYALDSTVDVFLSENHTEEGMHLTMITNGRLIAEHKYVTRYSYEVENHSDEEHVLYVQRARRTGWEITDISVEEDKDSHKKAPPQPGKDGVVKDETTYSVPINLPKNGRITVVVEEQTPGRRDVEILSSQGREIIALYISNPDADPDVAKALKETVALTDRLGSIDRRLSEISQQNAVLSQRQQQVRDNINQLRKGTAANDKLRSEQEKKLGDIDNKLDELIREHVQLTDERFKLNEQLVTMLKGITLKKK